MMVAALCDEGGGVPCSVNLGARLEGQTRNYDGVDVLLSSFTAEACPGRKFTEIDRIKVKGKEELVTILTV